MTSTPEERWYWIKLGTVAAANYELKMVRPWLKVFDDAELYAVFCVRAATLLEHGVKRLVSVMEERTGKQFTYTEGVVYKFVRIA